MWIDKEEDQDPYNHAQNNTNLNIGAGGGGASPISGSNTPQGNPSTISPASTNKTQNFATVQDYLGANKQQGEDLGQKVTSSLTDTQNNEQNQINSATEGAKSDINAGTVNYNSDLVNKAATSPTSVTSNPTDLNSFLSQWNANYTGPSSFENSNEYGNAASAANEASQKAAELGTTGGRQQLLQDQFNVYGQGNKGLDQALLQTSSSFPTIQNQAKGFTSVNDYLASKANEVNPLATAAQTATENTKANTQNAFSNTLSDFQNQVNTETKNAQDAASTNLSKYKQDFSSGNINAVSNDLTAMGVSPADAKNITSYLSALNTTYKQNPDVTNYFGNPATDINSTNVATPEEYANAAAYQKLTGVDYSGILNPANSAQAGTAPKIGIQSPNVSTYLKNTLDQQDKELTQEGTAQDVYNKMGIGDISKVFSNTDSSAQLGQQLIDAATRQGSKSGTALPAMNSVINSAAKAYAGPMQAAKLALAKQGITGNVSDPRIQQLILARPEMAPVLGAYNLYTTLSNWVKGVNQ